MSHLATRRSPIQHLLESSAAEFRDFAGSSYAVRFRSAEDEQRTLELLGLCDLSGLQKLGVKGPAAATWLTNNGLQVPRDIFASRPLLGGGMIVRFGPREFFLEDGIANANLPALAAKIGSRQDGLVRVEHQEATFVLTGHRCLELFAQTCGINFREALPDKVVFTRVAGVSCGILPESLHGGVPAYRLWVDPSYAVYLWETLAEICASLGGGVIGAGCIYSELLAQPLKETV
jgi:sarcosine oxidase subunit gamma